MNKDTAHTLIRTLGAATKDAMVDQGHKIEPMGDLFAGIGAVINMEITDDDIPGITEAFQIVMKDCNDAAWEMMMGEAA